MKTNETIARLDRVAKRLGLNLDRRGHNGREFDLDETRVIRYLPCGKGSLRVCSYLVGELDAETVCGPERIETLMMTAVRNRPLESSDSEAVGS